MPELPEVETVRAGLAPVWQGRRFAKIIVHRFDLRRPVPADFARILEGRRILNVGRRAKYLVVDLEGGALLLGHLGMSGRMIIGAGGDGPHQHIVFETDDGGRVAYADPRRFGLMDLGQDGRHPLLEGLGPEPLDDGFSAAVLADGLAGKDQAIKSALLDQGVVAGLGNIYVAESLFQAGISPLRAAGSLKGDEIGRLVTAIRDVLERAIAAGGSTLKDHARPDGELGYFQHSFAVYGRAGQPCPRCRGAIVRLVQSGRSTFHCEICQA